MNNNGYKKMNETISVQNNYEASMNHFFHCIPKDSKVKAFYIGTIHKLNSKFAFVELKNEGTHLLNMKTIINVSRMMNDEYKRIDIKKNLQHSNSYMIMHQELIPKLYIFSAIDTLLSKNSKALIGIDGNASSGKTTFANLIGKIYDCNIFHVDHYFQKPVINSSDPLSKYASNINFNRIHKEILDPYNNQLTSSIRFMDLKTHTLSKEMSVLYKPLTIIEGAYSLHPYIINNYDLTIMMKSTYIKQVFRVWKRNGFRKLLQYIKKWIPMENKYFKDLQIESKSNIILKR